MSLGQQSFGTEAGLAQLTQFRKEQSRYHIDIAYPFITRSG
jgi:hypothetical protein